MSNLSAYKLESIKLQLAIFAEGYYVREYEMLLKRNKLTLIDIEKGLCDDAVLKELWKAFFFYLFAHEAMLALGETNSDSITREPYHDLCELIKD